VFASCGNRSLLILDSWRITFLDRPLTCVIYWTRLLNTTMLSNCSILQITWLRVKKMDPTMKRYIRWWMHFMRLKDFGRMWRSILKKKKKRNTGWWNELLSSIIFWWLLDMWKRTWTLWEILCKIWRIEWNVIKTVCKFILSQEHLPLHPLSCHFFFDSLFYELLQLLVYLINKTDDWFKMYLFIFLVHLDLKCISSSS